MQLRTTIIAILSLAWLLAGCDPPSTADAVKKTEGISSKADLEKALGKPSEISKLGPLETWTYTTSDGSVSFVITGERVQLAAGGTRSK